MRFLVFINGVKDSEAGILPSEKPLSELGKFNEELVTAGVLLAGQGLSLTSNEERTATDYSEEAIPERDPAYRTLDGTLYETQTVDDMRPDVRLALARCLEQLGMSAVRAALVANL